MASREPAKPRASRKQKVLAWLQSRNPGRVDEAAVAALAADLPGLSPKLLRTALIESGRELTPMVEGVRQDDYGQLERTLLALAGEYEAAGADRRKQVRALVITARQHADWARRNPQCTAQYRAEKTEMLLWLRTWLENPPLFASWVGLRKRALDAAPADGLA